MSPAHPGDAPTLIRRIAILGTGLIGASAGLALRAQGFSGELLGWDPDPDSLAAAAARGAIDAPAHPHPTSEAAAFAAAQSSDLILLAGPVLTTMQWLERLAPVLTPAQLVTDVGSVKGFLVERAAHLYNGVDRQGQPQPGWLPGHPMAGKEHSGAAYAEPGLFTGAAWLFTAAALPDAAENDSTESVPTGNAPPPPTPSAELPPIPHPLAAVWIDWTRRFGAHPIALTAERHDTLCASISHLPQMLATALASMLGHALAAELDDQILQQIGGRALGEMTRLGASPYSMWRDIALTNQPALAAALLALEQQLTHLRENLKTAELRQLFQEANAFRSTLSRIP